VVCAHATLSREREWVCVRVWVPREPGAWVTETATPLAIFLMMICRVLFGHFRTFFSSLSEGISRRLLLGVVVAVPAALGVRAGTAVKSSGDFEIPEYWVLAWAYTLV